MELTCAACGKVTTFEQPYPLHAGFSNLGFLYNDSGTLTLTWSSFDPTFERLVGAVHPWELSATQRVRLESSLLPAPSGGAWRFSNPARCPGCSAPISPPISESIYFVRFPGSPEEAAGLTPFVVTAV
jgi:hypothetical protein